MRKELETYTTKLKNDVLRKANGGVNKVRELTIKKTEKVSRLRWIGGEAR